MPQITDFKSFEALLPRVRLGSWPTDVMELAPPQGRRAPASLWVKRDDRAGTVYGGNKIRKLEFLLADAQRRGAKRVLTFGVAGSNHVLATALSARSHALDTIAIMTHQSNSRYVAKNLLMQLHAGADLHIYNNERLAAIGSRWQRLRHLRRDGVRAYPIPGGGSSALGAVGFVLGGLEFATQIAAGTLPAPDVIYVALGTMGTAAGLLLGLQAAGLATRVVAVRVVREDIGNRAGCLRLANAARVLLARHEQAFGELELDARRLVVRDEFFGRQYAAFTTAGQAAVRDFAADYGLALDGTYTGKTAACMLADARAGALVGQHVLFWNTLNSRDLRPQLLAQDYRRLPRPFWRYFETPVQPLDR